MILRNWKRLSEFLVWNVLFFICIAIIHRWYHQETNILIVLVVIVHKTTQLCIIPTWIIVSDPSIVVIYIPLSTWNKFATIETNMIIITPKLKARYRCNNIDTPSRVVIDSPTFLYKLMLKLITSSLGICCMIRVLDLKIYLFQCAELDWRVMQPRRPNAT